MVFRRYQPVHGMGLNSAMADVSVPHVTTGLADKHFIKGWCLCLGAALGVVSAPVSDSGGLFGRNGDVWLELFPESVSGGFSFSISLREVWRDRGWAAVPARNGPVALK